jgi:putative endonuclease
MIGRWLDALRHWGRRRRWNSGLSAGRRGEDLAHRFLREQGYTIVARNYRLASGDAEADLIAWEQDTLVVVEVKSRTSADFGPPERAFDAEKHQHLLRAARQYARVRSVPMENVRFDLVTVLLIEPPELKLFKGVSFSAKRRNSKRN